MGRWVFAIAALVASLAWSREAAAYHTGADFGEPAVDGGGGGIFYVAMPLERGWDCTMCHVDPPGRLSLRVNPTPSELFESFRYAPEQEYAFDVQLVWEGGQELGAASSRSNFNSLAVGVADEEGLFAGTLQGGGFVSGSGNGTIASEGLDNALDRFTFRWFAPAAGRGTVKLYFGAVDGNGADSPPEVTRTDPLGDDVFMAQVTLEEGTGGAATAVAPTGGWKVTFPPPDRELRLRKPRPIVFRMARAAQLVPSAAGSSPPPLPACAAVLCLLALGWRRRRIHTRDES